MLLKETNCKFVFFGIESGSEKILKVINKKLKLEDSIFDKVRLLTDNNITVETNFIIGFPEEDIEDLYKTVDMMAKLALRKC